MTDDHIVRARFEPKLKGIMKGKEDEEKDINVREIRSDFDDLILDMKGMLGQDLAQNA